MKEAGERYQNLYEKQRDQRRKKACERCDHFSEEDKEKSCQYYNACNKNLFEDQKQRLVEYRGNCYI